MKVKKIVPEDFSNYKKISMFIGTATCDWKCCKESGGDSSICQNAPMAKEPTLDIDISYIVSKYLDDPLTNAVVIGGLEPFDQFDEISDFVKEFRLYSDDDIVIYTGYNEDEITDQCKKLSKYPNIIVKFGRYYPNNVSKYDPVLGVELASPNQYARVLSDKKMGRFIRNPKLTDEEFNELKESLKANDGYCPCMLEHTPETKCMCKEFREGPLGTCHCGLYEKF